jgi:VacB/RNase II family 3'-5' exoribonuclease
MDTSDRSPVRALLQNIATREMFAHGFAPEFSPEVHDELDAIAKSFGPAVDSARDLRALLWCSIDNDDSRDLDQLSVAEARQDGAILLRVAIADVAATVTQGSAIDSHARKNTTSVYTAARIFPMLPERLSTDLTSLNPGEDRLAVVVEMLFSETGSLLASDIYPAAVHNHAQLAYDSVAAWLDDAAPAPPALDAVAGLGDNIRLQARVCRTLSVLRHDRGALSLETIRTRPVFDDDVITELKADTPNSAKRLIEDLMIASNGVTVRYLAAKGFPSIRRVVKVPRQWGRIVELASEKGVELPGEPDAKALELFLIEAQRSDPVRFPDLSLTIIKLMGSGEYVLELPGESTTGHFGLAVKDYSHSTAPNRRFPDVITQRLLKAAMAGESPPYSNEELDEIAIHCTQQEDAAKKVERHLEKSAAAILLASAIGRQFDAIVTGVTDRGTWVRIFQPPVEGKLTGGGSGLRVGNRLHVKLVATDVDRGYIDFAAVG